MCHQVLAFRRCQVEDGSRLLVVSQQCPAQPLLVMSIKGFLTLLTLTAIIRAIYGILKNYS